MKTSHLVPTQSRIRQATHIFEFYFVVFIPTPSQFQFTIKFPEPIVGDAVSLHAITDQFCLVLFAQQNLNTFRQYFISLNLDRYFCSCLSYWEDLCLAFKLLGSGVVMKESGLMSVMMMTKWDLSSFLLSQSPPHWSDSGYGWVLSSLRLFLLCIVSTGCCNP